MIKIMSKYRSIKIGIKNIIRWIPVLYEDRDFDYNYLLIIFNKKLKHMEDFFIQGRTYTKDAKKYGEQIKIARILTDRLLLDDYSPKPFEDRYSRRNLRHMDYMKMQDLKFLSKFMSKHLLYWWD